MGDSNNNNKISKGFILVLVLFLIGICSKDEKEDGNTERYSPPKQEESAPPLVLDVRIDRLISDYDANEVAADALYKGKIFKVQGVIADFGTEPSGHKYVAIEDYPKTSPYYLKCVFEHKYDYQLAEYTEGHLITVMGKCLGMSNKRCILMDECQVFWFDVEF